MWLYSLVIRGQQMRIMFSAEVLGKDLDDNLYDTYEAALSRAQDSGCNEVSAWVEDPVRPGNYMQAPVVCRAGILHITIGKIS